MRIFDILIMCNFKHWFRKPLQLFFLFLGISLATTLWSSIQLINTQAKKSYESATLLISSKIYNQTFSNQLDSLVILEDSNSAKVLNRDFSF